MTTVTPPGSPTNNIGNHVESLEGFFSWTLEAGSDTGVFTLTSPIDPIDGGTRVVFHSTLGDFDAIDGNMPDSGTVSSMEIWNVDGSSVATLESTWTLSSTFDISNFRTWIALDDATPPAEGEIGAGAQNFMDAIFGGNDTITGTGDTGSDSDELFGFAGNDILISNGPGGGGELLSGGSGDDTIRLAGDYSTDSVIAGGDDMDTVEIGDGAAATDIFGNAVLATNVSKLISPNTGSVSSIEAITFAASGNSAFLVSANQISTLDGGFMDNTVVTGDSHSNYLTIVVTDAGADDLADLTGGLGFTFENWSAGDFVSLVVGDSTSTAAYQLSGNFMDNILIGATGDDTLLGDVGDDILVGGAGGQDTLDGQEGDDIITSAGAGGGATADSLIGGDTDEDNGDTLLALGSQSFISAFGSAAVLDGFENLTLAKIPSLSSVTSVSASFTSSQLGSGLAADLFVTGNAGWTDNVRIDVVGGAPNVILSGWTFASDWGTGAGFDEIRVVGDGNANMLTGTSQHDSLDGGAGADTLFGGGGDDQFYAGPSGSADSATDHMWGGDGNDSYGVFEAGDIVHENASEGTADRVAAWNLATYTLTTNVENLTIYGTGLNGVGNTLANTIEGNNLANVLSGLSGNDFLFGGLGNDTLIGGVGGDSLDGGGGFDTASYATSAARVVVNLNTGAASFGDAAGDSFTAIENLTGSAFNDTLTGNASANVLTGGAGIDVLNGLGGIDTMIGGDGNDTYVVDVAGDVTTESSTTGGTDLVQSAVTRTLGANLENLTLTGAAIINGTGNTLANTITGNTGANVLSGLNGADTLSGGAGADTLNGGLAHDTLTGGAAADKFVFNAPAAAAHSDTITDFTHNSDKIQFENSVFTQIGAAGALNANAFFAGANAHDASDRIIYNAATGALYYDDDGTGAHAKVLIATLTTHPVLTSTDIQVI